MRLRLLTSIAILAAVTACGHSTDGTTANAVLPAGARATQAAHSSSSPMYTAVALPSGFVPRAITKGGQIPGRIGTHAAVYANGQLTILPDFPGCGHATINATGANDRGEVVGLCNVRRNGINFGIPLYYFNGSVKRLSVESNDTYGVDIKINDKGVIVGVFDRDVIESGELVRFFTDGDHPIDIGDAGIGFTLALNESGQIAVTQYQPGYCCQAA